MMDESEARKSELLTGGNENGHNDIFACKSK